MSGPSRPGSPASFAGEFAESSAMAARFASVLGDGPHSFTSAIRKLMSDAREGRTSMSEQNTFQMSRLLKGRTLLANLYYATRIFCPDYRQSGIQEPLDLARVHHPSVLSAILALSYLFKRAKRISDPEEWRFIGDKVEDYTHAGARIGLSCPGIGPAVGLLGAALPLLAMTAFLAEDKGGFQKYRRALKDRLYDPARELETWGCTSWDIAARLLIWYGFGVDSVNDFTAACSGAPDQELSRGAQAYRRVRRILDGGRSGVVDGVRFSLPDLLAEASGCRWMSRTNEDLTQAVLSEIGGLSDGKKPRAPKKTSQTEEQQAPPGQPEKAAAPEPPAQPAPSNEESLAPDLPTLCTYDELPAHLKEMISPTEFNQLKHMPLEEIAALFE